jgi:hypothetical protein
MIYRIISALVVILLIPSAVLAQDDFDPADPGLYGIPPRWVIDMPTAGTLPRGNFDMSVRVYSGGALGMTNIGLSNRLQVGIAFGGGNIVSNQHPKWNPRIEFNVKFRVIDELEYFPAVTAGFSSQGYGAWDEEVQRYAFKSRGFYGVASRSFYFYNWTAGWHLGINYTLESDIDKDKDINFFGGLESSFRYNLGLAMEYDAAINDDRSKLPNGDPNSFAGKGRGYLNLSIKWLFADNLQLEALAKDLLVNRRESETFAREVRLTYNDSF